MNKVILVGRITEDPEVRYMNNEDQTAYVNFSIAVTRDYDREKADFIRCKAFGRLAELIGEYVEKGRQLAVCGRWETGSYENRDGDTVYTNECRVDTMDLIGSGKPAAEEKKDTRKKGRR